MCVNFDKNTLDASQTVFYFNNLKKKQLKTRTNERKQIKQSERRRQKNIEKTSFFRTESIVVVFFKKDANLKIQFP